MVRKLCLLVAAALLISMLVVPAHAGNWPKVTGTYAGKAYIFSDPTTFYEGEVTVKIIQQVGPVFRGEKSWFEKSIGYAFSEPFAGSVNEDGELFIAEHQDGYSIGKVSGNKMELRYVEGGLRHKAMVYELMKK